MLIKKKKILLKKEFKVKPHSKLLTSPNLKVLMKILMQGHVEVSLPIN